MASKVTADIPKQWKQFGKIVQQEFSKALRRSGAGALREVQRQFVLADAIASQKTFDSIKLSELQMLGDRMSIEVAPTGDRARIMNFIEFGRRPGRQPPPGPIMEWLLTRKIVSEGEDPEKVRALAWYISRQIAEYGIEPKHIFEKAEQRYASRIVQIFEAAARRVVKRIEEKNANSNGQSDSGVAEVAA
jgi:hypothetical protein